MSMRSTRALVALSALLALTAACGTVGPGDGPLAELESNRERWDRFGPSSYVFGIERMCFCAETARGPVRVTVVNGTAVAREYVSSGDPVPANLEDLFPTVDGLFDVLRDALERDAFRIDVTYDPQLGVPIDFFIDYQQNVADEELGFEVTEAVAPSTP